MYICAYTNLNEILAKSISCSAGDAIVRREATAATHHRICYVSELNHALVCTYPPNILTRLQAPIIHAEGQHLPYLLLKCYCVNQRFTSGDDLI